MSGRPINRTLRARRFSGTAGAHRNWRRTLDEHAKTARAMQRSIKENLTRVEQAIETYREQVHMAAELEGELTRLATLVEIEMSVLTLAGCAAGGGAIQPFQDRHGRWHSGREPSPDPARSIAGGRNGALSRPGRSESQQAVLFE